MGNEWDSLWNWVTRAGQGAGDWIGNAGNQAYNWGSENPTQALSLGMGAVGTGMGIWDQYQASQRLKDRQKLAEQYAKMGPGAFAPNYSPQQLQAMYFRPAAQNMALAGQTDGGAFRQALADSALKAESDRIQLGNQIFQSRVGSLGYGPPQGPSGNTGAFGGALQNVMLMNALKGRAPYGPAQTQQPQGPAQFSMTQPQQPNSGGGGFYPSGAYQTPPNAAWTAPLYGGGASGMFSPGQNERYNAGYPSAGGRDSFLGNDMEF